MQKIPQYIKKPKGSATFKAAAANIFIFIIAMQIFAYLLRPPAYYFAVFSAVIVVSAILLMVGVYADLYKEHKNDADFSKKDFLFGVGLYLLAALAIMAAVLFLLFVMRLPPAK